MNTSPAQLLEYIIEVAKRRRRLLILPLAIILPLGLLFANFGPKTYVARSLLLMQESGADFPFARELTGINQTQERLFGLKALIKSDLVINSVLGDVMGATAPTDPKAVKIWIDKFSAALSLEMIGNEFLDIQLKGSSPMGLGRQLEAVTLRFLEVLLSTDETLSATQVLLERRKEDRDAAQRALNQFKMHAEKAVPTDTQLIKRTAATNSFASQLRELEEAVERANEDYQSYTKRFGGATARVRAQGLLRAPERIKMIDPPRDPEVPATTALKIALLAALASLLASIGLAGAAELLDPTIRRPNQLEALTGAPIWARLPRF